MYQTTSRARPTRPRARSSSSKLCRRPVLPHHHRYRPAQRYRKPSLPSPRMHRRKPTSARIGVRAGSATGGTTPTIGPVQQARSRGYAAPGRSGRRLVRSSSRSGTRRQVGGTPGTRGSISMSERWVMRLLPPLPRRGCPLHDLHPLRRHGLTTGSRSLASVSQLHLLPHRN